MTPEESAGLIRRAMGEMWNEGKLEVCDEMYAAHCSFHDPSFTVDGVSGMRDQVSQLRAAQPDLHVDVQQVLVDGDMSVGRWTMAGTARGQFRGLPATGKTYVMTGMTMSKWEDDRIVEEWTNYDLLGALQQLGIVPEMAGRESGG